VKRVSVCATAIVSLAFLTADADAATGPALWSQAGCGGCHTLGAAGSSGTVGPNLDALKPSSAAVAAQVASGGGGMPSFSGSLTSSEIQQLADWVSSAASGGSSSAAATATSPNPSMPVSAVRKLQHALHRLGYFNGPFTGFYGPITTSAVKRFQRTHGLQADGIWGPASRAALAQALGVTH
jgi:peptidoglycan hydrolase-like protein with peptidoglycan-binding domain